MNPMDRINQLTADLARSTAELEECREFWTAEADKAATRTTELVRNSAYWEAEAATLRARVAELEKERDGVKDLMRLRLKNSDVTTLERDELKQRNAVLETDRSDLLLKVTELRRRIYEIQQVEKPALTRADSATSKSDPSLSQIGMSESATPAKQGGAK